VSDKSEFIRCRARSHHREHRNRAVHRRNVCTPENVPLRILRMERPAGVSHRGKTRRTEAVRCQSFEDSDGTYGYRRVHADLVDWGMRCGPELVRSLIPKLGLEPCQPKPCQFSLTDNDGQTHHFPDLVQRDFGPTH
jgi:hypothetical protein